MKILMHLFLDENFDTIFKEYEDAKIFSWVTISLSKKNCDSPFNNLTI